MASRLLPRLLPFRLATSAPSRSFSASGLRPARRRVGGRPPRAASSFSPDPFSASTDSSSQHDPSPTARQREARQILDSDDPLNLKGKRAAPPVSVRFFEQDVSQVGESEPRPVSEERMAADTRTAAELWGKISRLEREVAELERDDGGMDAALIRLRAIERGDADLDPGSPAAEQVVYLKEADPGQVRAEMDALRVVVGEAAEYRAKESVEVLNNCLRAAYLATEPEKRPIIRQELWKAYKRAKMHAGPGVLFKGIPAPAWDMLFYSQAVRWKSNKKREEHMRELLADMKSIGMDGPPTSPPDGRGVESILKESTG